MGKYKFKQYYNPKIYAGVKDTVHGNTQKACIQEGGLLVSRQMMGWTIQLWIMCMFTITMSVHIHQIII